MVIANLMLIRLSPPTPLSPLLPLLPHPDTLLEDLPQLTLVILVTVSCGQDLKGISQLSVIVTCAAIFFALVKVPLEWVLPLILLGGG